MVCKTTGVLAAKEVVGARDARLEGGRKGAWKAVSDYAIYLELPHWNFPKADFWPESTSG